VVTANQARQSLANTVASLNASFDAGGNANAPMIGGASGLPAAAAEKLRRARADREDAHVLYLRASDAERDARQALNSAQNIARQQLQAPGGFVIDGGVVARTQLGTRDERTTLAMAPVEKAELALKAAMADRERAAERYNSFAFVSTVNDWLSRFGDLGNLREVEVETPTVKGDPLSAILSIRAKIAKLNDDLVKVEEAPTPAEILRAQAHAEIDDVAAASALRIHRCSRSGTPLGLAEKMHIRTAPSGALIGTAGTGVLIWLLRDQFKAEADLMIAELNLEGALSEDEQEALTRQITQDRLTLERQEEALLVAAEIGGWPIPRRSDLDPRAFLGVEA